MSSSDEKRALIKNNILTIPDYPKKGILFRDITTLLQNPEAFRASIDLLVDHYQHKNINKVVGTEARGFIFSAPIALALDIPFIPIRKPNKLPRHVFKEEYQLEYGSDTLEMHTDAIKQDDNVLIVDDLLATGGTVAATAKLIRKAGGIARHATFVINLPDLGGEKKLNMLGLDCFTLVDFKGE